MGALLLEEVHKAGLEIDNALLGRLDDAQERGPALGNTDASGEKAIVVAAWRGALKVHQPTHAGLQWQ